MRNSVMTLRSATLLLLILLNVVQTSSAQTPSACPGFRTYTQGGYGTAPSGNNVGTFLNNNFAAVFPAGLEIGCTNKLRLTSATAVRNFLPQTGTPKTLSAGTISNPTKSNYANVFAGQLVTLKLNIQFDNALASFAPSVSNLSNLIISSGTFTGWTVGKLFTEANNCIGGCSTLSYTPTQYNAAIDLVNNAYDNGVVKNNFLVCPMKLSISGINPTCSNSNNGKATVLVDGGVGPFTYSWTCSNQTTATVTNLGTGVCSVTVTDQTTRLTATTNITISAPSPLVVTNVVGNLTCNQENATPDGAISLSASGSTPGYSVLWSDGATDFARTGLAAGSYCYTVTDKNGCSASGCATLTQPEPLRVSISLDNGVRCHGECNAAMSASANGGTAPYSYLWTGGAVTASVVNVCSGNYAVTATDSKGCMAHATDFLIGNPDTLVASSSTSDVSACTGSVCDGSVAVDVTGGVGQYQISWTKNGTTVSSTDFILNNLCTGDVVMSTVTDKNGCSVTISESTISCKQTTCDPLKTFTQGGWGAAPNGNNPGVYLHANFAAAFPDGISIGCDNKILFTSAQAITDWLPSGSTPAALPAGTMVDPTAYDNVLAAQLLAAELNVGFDAYDPAFGGGSQALSDMYILSGTFAGMKVNEIISAANDVIGGCSTAYSFPDLNAALTQLNENYDNGTVDRGNFACTYSAERMSQAIQANMLIELNPNPAIDRTKIKFNAPQSESAELVVMDLTGRTVFATTISIQEGKNEVSLNVSDFTSQQCVISIRSASFVVSRGLLIVKN